MVDNNIGENEKGNEKEKEKEKFDLKKWLSGFVNPTTWSKSVMFFVMILFILFGSLTIYRAFFMKTGSNVHRPFMIALPGSTVTADMSSEQKLEQKRKWWQPIPFFEIYGGASTSFNTDNNKFGKIEPEVGGRVGIRWDF